MNDKRFDVGDQVLVTRSHGSDKVHPFKVMTIYGLVYGRLYDYFAQDETGVIKYLCDEWLAPSAIVIPEDVDLTDIS